ncbi:MerR family transcriptional regulator [Pseudomonas vranovensis]|uniref:Helix-turn-helix-type transcriptional regulator n=1 Tax=Pseudomonas vranovensis TaxID=321661 RepID=A0A423E0N5_9PSED|nr:MerR family transcriptional regulator [Pseudomonas vranovensis]ROL78958.1 helix-turn-helix-type transcriptional regulator [Pseudomonas vranovensis]
MPSETLLPIREVTRLTGINPVTLRAWERRYGLIVPQRTGKGHRLYSQEDVQRIQQILTWLDRGAAVSQVKALLQANPGESPAPAGSDWQALREQLKEAIAALAERRLEQQLNQAMALYPAPTLCEQLLMPLLADLELRWQGQFAAGLEQVFFHSWLRSKLGARVYHNNHQLGGAPLLLVNGSDLAFDPRLWLMAWLASNAGYPVQVFDWPPPGNELSLAVAQLRPWALLLSIDKSLDMARLQRNLVDVEIPKLLCGRAVSIHKHALQAWTDETLFALDSPQAALQCLRQLRGEQPEIHLQG